MTPIPAATTVAIKPIGPIRFTLARRPPQIAAPTPVTPDTIALTARVKDQTGDPFADQSVAWSSTNEAVASVDSSGCVTPHGVGTCSIVATAHADAKISDRISCEVDA